MSAKMSVAGIVVNGGEPMRGEFSVEQDCIDVTTCGGEWKPDPAWTHVDAAGHFHAYGHDGELPTLRYVRRKRKPSVYRCIACNKKVEPGGRRDFSRKQMAGRQDWTLTVEGEVPNEQFSFRYTAGEREYFGFAKAVDVHVTGGFPDRPQIRSECSAHPVSWRKVGDAA